MHLHGRDQLRFSELDFAGQARSINGTARHDERALERHLELAIEQSRDPEEVYLTTASVYLSMLERVAGGRGFRVPFRRV